MEQQITNHNCSAVLSQRVAVGLLNPSDAPQQEVAAVHARDPIMVPVGNPVAAAAARTNGPPTVPAGTPLAAAALPPNDFSDSWSESIKEKKPKAKKQKKN